MLRLIFILSGFFSSLSVAQEDVDVYSLSTLDWPPYISPDVENNGYVFQVVQEAYLLSDKSVKSDFLPWSRALLNTSQGQYVGIYPEYYDPSREEHFVFSEPFPGGPAGLMLMKQRQPNQSYDIHADLDRSLDSFEGAKFGVVRGYLNNEQFDRAEHLDKHQTLDDENSLVMLMLGRVNLIFIDKLVADYLIETRIPQLKGKVGMLNELVEYKPLYIAFSKAHPHHEKARLDFNQGLKKLQESGRLAQIMHENGIPAQPKRHNEEDHIH